MYRCIFFVKFAKKSKSVKTSKVLFAVMASLMPFAVYAQYGNASFGGSLIDEFNSFRSETIEEFDAFQKQILNEYITFIGGKLEDTRHYGDNLKPSRPKPSVPPALNPSTVVPGLKDVVNVDDDTADSVEVVSLEQVSTESLAVFTKNKAAENKKTETPTLKEETVQVPAENNIEIDIYGLQLSWPSIDMSKLSFTTSGSYWKGVKLMVDTSRLTDAIRESAIKYSLGSWCTLLAVNKYVEKLLDGQNTPAVMTLTHYLMSDLGYDLVLGIINGNDTRLFIPFDQAVYDTDYANYHGKRYYIYPKMRLTPGTPVSLASLPVAENSDELTFNLVINPSLVIPRDDISFSVTDSVINLQGNVNGNLINLMKDYPLMDTEYYAMSMADSEMRDQVLDALRPQIEALETEAAANELLHFIHNAFEYKTDGNQFGAEKPFFLEEIFYYPFSDCEDRAILYSFLVHYLLDLDVVLLTYPNHVCTGVALPAEPSEGDLIACIVLDNKRYYVCDPTFIGSDVGMPQTSFIGVTPSKVTKWY